MVKLIVGLIVMIPMCFLTVFLIGLAKEYFDNKKVNNNQTKKENEHNN